MKKFTRRDFLRLSAMAAAGAVAVACQPQTVIVKETVEVEKVVKETGVVELPVSWELDDAPHFLFNFFPFYFSGLSSPSKVFEIWKDEFDYLYEKESFYVLTMHPQIIARPHRIMMLEKLIKYIMGFPGVWFARHDDAAKDYLIQLKSKKVRKK